MGLLDGKVALITGAGGGLGEAYAKQFAREGAAVVVNDLGVPRGGSGADGSMPERVVAAIKAEGGQAISNGADISIMDGGQSLFEDAIRHFGRADILVNNAGILRDKTFAKSNEADWDKVIKVHLKGTYCATLPVFRWMRDNGGGVIVNTSAGAGLIGSFGQSNYSAAKGGIWGLSNTLAIEGRKYNIRVWTLNPSALTGMTADLPDYRESALAPMKLLPSCSTWSATCPETKPERCLVCPVRVGCARCAWWKRKVGSRRAPAGKCSTLPSTRARSSSQRRN